MPTYGPWQEPLEHTFEWDVFATSPGPSHVDWLTGPETPHSGLMQLDDTELRGEAFFERRPEVPLVYEEDSSRDAVYTQLLSGLFEDGNTLGSVPGPGPGEAGLHGADAWVGGTSLPGFGGAWAFWSINGIPVFVGDISWSAYFGFMKIQSYSFEWDPDVAQPDYQPDSSRWPAGAIGVDMDPAGEVVFTEAILLGTTFTTEDVPLADQSTTLALMMSPPGAKTFVHPYSSWEEGFPPSPPSSYIGGTHVTGDVEIAEFDRVRLWLNGSSGPGEDPPDPNNQFALAVGPTGFFPGPPLPGSPPPDPGANNTVTYAQQPASLKIRVSFTTAPYRYIFPTPTVQAPMVEAFDQDDGLTLPATPVPATRTRLVD